MRVSTIFTTLLLATSLSLAACAVDTSTNDEETVVTAEDALSRARIAQELTGNWKSDAAYPRVGFMADKSFSLDTGMRCPSPMCTPVVVGKWSLYRARGVDFVRLDATNKKVTYRFRVNDTSKKITSLTGTENVTGTFKKIVEAPCNLVDCRPGYTCDDSSGKALCLPQATCAVTLCAPDTMCDDSSGIAKCVPFLTCNTTKCAGGDYCVERPIVCKKAPCPPTAPSCEVCPAPGTWINCMPGTSPSDPRCSTQGRASITANCEGVDFAF